MDSSPAVLVHRYNITQKKRAELLFAEQRAALEQYAAALCTACSHLYQLPCKLHQMAGHVHVCGNVHVNGHGVLHWFALVHDSYTDCIDGPE